MFAGLPKSGARVAVASTLDTSVAPVMPAGTVGVAEIDDWEVARAMAIESTSAT